MHGDAAGQLGEALLQLLAVVVGVGVLDLLRGSERTRASSMSSVVPAPSTMVVSSLETTTLRGASPARSRSALSSGEADGPRR